ncbi:flagellar basal body rod protein [Bacillus infantis]|uniref:lmo0954 family membrane protein n=1 Tax=Bacillus infantis TaxID=324767 RepID=UPI003CEA430C
MKKFGLLLAGGIAGLVLLSNLGPMIGLAISLLILYFVFKQFLKADSTGAKIGWGIVGVFALTAAASNIPAILGIAAAYILYVIYKKWNDKKTFVKEDQDPFTSFEKEWSKINQY